MAKASEQQGAGSIKQIGGQVTGAQLMVRYSQRWTGRLINPDRAGFPGKGVLFKSFNKLLLLLLSLLFTISSAESILLIS